MVGLSPMLDRESGIPLFRQLYTYVRMEIESGRLEPGRKLPSIRELSAFLLVGRNTVEAAYQQLIAEGYVDSRPRSGLYAASVEAVMGAPSAAGGKEAEPRAKEIPGQPEIDFQYGHVALREFPIRAWKRALAEALDGDPAAVLGYGELQGNAELRAEIARYLFATRGIACPPERIFLAAGTQQAISLLCRLLPLEGPIGMEEPGYDGARSVFSDHRLELVPIAVSEDDGLDVDALGRSGAKTIYATPAHQFPLGAVLPALKRNRLLQWAEETGGYVIEDDYDGEFRYQGQPIPALKAMDVSDRVIYAGTFSKAFLPGIRISYLVLPEALAGGFRERLAPYSQSVSPLIQQAMLLFMRQGHYERHVRKTRKLYRARHRALTKAVRSLLGDRVRVIGQKAGLHLLLDVPGSDGEELAERALRLGVKVYPTSVYWMRRDNRLRSVLMLGFGGLSEADIERGVGLLRRAWFEEGFGEGFVEDREGAGSGRGALPSDMR